MDQMDKLIVFLSLLVTPVTILSALMVVCLWASPAKQAIVKKERGSIDWFVLGVFVHFLGSVLDNGYWGVAWTFDYIDSPHRDAVFDKGAWSNLPFRQIATTVAAYCHIKAAVDSNLRLFRLLFAGTAIVTAIYAAFLMFS